MNFMKNLVDLFFEKVLNVTEDNIGDEDKMQQYQLTSKSKKQNLNKSQDIMNTGESKRKRIPRKNNPKSVENDKKTGQNISENVEIDKTHKQKRKHGVNFVKIEEKPEEEDFNTNEQSDTNNKSQINTNIFSNIKNLVKGRTSLFGDISNKDNNDKDKFTLKNMNVENDIDEYSDLKSDKKLSIIKKGIHKNSTKTKKFSYLINKQSLLSSNDSKDKSDYFQNSESSEEKYSNNGKKSISTPSKNLLKSIIVKEKKLSNTLARDKNDNDELLSSDIVKINSLISEKGILGRNSKEISKFNYKDKQLRDSFYNKFSNKDYENSSNKSDVNILSNNANNLKVSKSVLKKDDFMKNLTNKIVI